MSTLPIRDRQFKTADFLSWLASNGAEIGIPTNAYELARYKAYTSGASKALTHIVYRKDNGLITWTGASMKHYQAFIEGADFIWGAPYGADAPKPKKKSKGRAKKVLPAARRREKVAERDGSDCWFCGTTMGEDCTLEHLVPQSRGGGNDLANLVLAHQKCNLAAANLSISEKVELRSKMRSVPA